MGDFYGSVISVPLHQSPLADEKLPVQKRKNATQAIRLFFWCKGYLDICQGLLSKPVVATGKSGVIRDTEALLDLELTWKLTGQNVEQLFF